MLISGNVRWVCVCGFGALVEEALGATKNTDWAIFTIMLV